MWTDYLAADGKVRAIFGAAPPALSQLKLRRAVLKDSGHVELYADFAALPENAPERWRKTGATLQLNIGLSGAADLVMTDPAKWTICSITIEKAKLTVFGAERRVLFASSYIELFADFLPYASAQQTRKCFDESPHLDEH